MPENVPQLKRKRRKRRRNNGLGYLLLFALVFTSALFGLSYAVKFLSPDVDVAIGNNESTPLNESEMDVEIKTIDERLKWIQMEDELPSVSIRISQDRVENKQDKNKIEEKKDNKKEAAPKKDIAEIVNKEEKANIKTDFRFSKNNVNTPVVNQISKVYLGKYETIEEAVKIQHQVSSEETEIVPFIKAINGKYVVQIGSFSDSERAKTLVNKMKSKGYPAKISVEK